MRYGSFQEAIRGKRRKSGEKKQKAPISLDFFEEEPFLTDTSALQQSILDFLGRPEVKSRINLYRQLIH
jgi:hypothetical protein